MAIQAISTPADIVNLALSRIGFKGRIGSLYEGSIVAKKALDCYAPTRDAILREGDWDFAGRTVVLTLLKSAPVGGYVPGVTDWNPATNPQPPWMYEYANPDDCLKVRNIKGQAAGLINFSPRPSLYTIGNDTAYTPSRKIILCNQANAMMTYTGQVTDPLQWNADFVEAMAAALARRLAPGTSNLEMAKAEAQDEKFTADVAAKEQG